MDGFPLPTKADLPADDSHGRGGSGRRGLAAGAAVPRALLRENSGPQRRSGGPAAGLLGVAALDLFLPFRYYKFATPPPKPPPKPPKKAKFTGNASDFCKKVGVFFLGGFGGGYYNIYIHAIGMYDISRAGEAGGSFKHTRIVVIRLGLALVLLLLFANCCENLAFEHPKELTRRRLCLVDFSGPPPHVYAFCSCVLVLLLSSVREPAFNLCVRTTEVPPRLPLIISLYYMYYPCFGSYQEHFGSPMATDEVHKRQVMSAWWETMSII